MRRAARNRACGWTFYECITTLILACLVIFVGALLLGIAMPDRMKRRKAKCKRNLARIGKAINMYREDNDHYFPFSWMPANAGAPRRKDALTSLGCLYPGYLTDVNCFRCPVRMAKPWLRFNAPFPIRDTNTDGHITNTDLRAGQEYLWKLRNYTVRVSSYGYDCRIRPKAAAGHAIAGDMDGTFRNISNAGVANHEYGQHILYVDGSVKWHVRNFVSDADDDHIFAENPWHADTDSFISDNTAALSDAASVPVPWYWDNTPDQYNNLSVSYDAYPDLHPDARED